MAYIYVNGQLAGSTAVAGTLNTNSAGLAVGSLATNSEFFNGQIDEVKIYNTALTPDQIIVDMNYTGNSLAWAAGGSSEASLLSDGAGNPPVGQWNFDEGSGQVLTDSSGHNNSGQLGSAAGVDANDPTWKSAGECKTSKCLGFNGSSTYASVTNPFGANTTQGTASVWVKFSSYSADSNVLFRILWAKPLSTHLLLLFKRLIDYSICCKRSNEFIRNYSIF